MECPYFDGFRYLKIKASMNAVQEAAIVVLGPKSQKPLEILGVIWFVGVAQQSAIIGFDDLGIPGQVAHIHLEHVVLREASSQTGQALCWEAQAHNIILHRGKDILQNVCLQNDEWNWPISEQNKRAPNYSPFKIG